jgi:aminoglycoside phosphotransferase (APT) family kinase protein
VSSNVTDALVAEGADAQADLSAKVRKVTVQMSLIMVPGIALVVVAAPQIMQIFGSGYTDDGATVLRLLALSAIPNAVTTIVVAVAHVRQRLSLVIVLQSVMAALTLGLAWVLVGSHGVQGVAMSWLIAQSVTAVLALIAVARLEAALLRSTRGWLVSRVSAGRRLVARAQAWQVVRANIGVVPKGALPDGKVGILAHQHDLLVLSAGSAAVPLVVRVATGANGHRVVRAHEAALDAIHDDPRLRPIAALAPDLLAVAEDARWLVETRVPGQSVCAMSGTVTPEAARAGLDLLERLHGATAQQVIAGTDEVDRWVHRPIATVARNLHDEGAVRGLAALHARLNAELLGRPLTVARLHGDPSFDNILLADDGRTVTGVVDWEASQVGLPEIDVITLVLARRGEVGDEELGQDVLDLLANGWSAPEQALLGRGWSVNAHVRPTTLVLLAWLGHVSANLEKAERYGTNRWWIHHNVEAVLRGLADVEAIDLNATDDLDGAAAMPSPVELGALASDAVAEPAVAAAAAAARAPLVPRSLRLPVVAASLAAWAAYALDAPVLVRVLVVVAAVGLAPALALGRRTATDPDERLRRAVVGGAGAVALDVVLAELLLYSGLWSAGRFLALVCASTIALCLVRSGPPEVPAEPADISRRGNHPVMAIGPDVIDLRAGAGTAHKPGASR